MIGLKDASRQFLAWKSIKEDSEDLNLDSAQNRETQNMLERCDRTIEDRIRETYCWLLVPYIDLDVSKSDIVWETISIRGGTDKRFANGLTREDPDRCNISKWPGRNLLGFTLMEIRGDLRV